ncbi:tyrosine-type recombinase/integrase [Lederbergia sp. NSJ-179]|uniref:tyrosine-type recombinase/integrase n=1 Tax=Lederbergia sp. NSJ-179 TaxID=2931402 RepID=UPI001FD10FF6|nr:tyrosine-type recombinase/integrase [Lederbergia sp. NSJ-179]MCJ7842124.1 tyrosine-type recombinase/integrase [Lederbergia sp. NSJ-179]
MNGKTCFLSNFAPLLQSFIEEKNSLGYKYESECNRLRHFDLYCLETSRPAVLDKSLVDSYLTPDANRSAKTTLNIIGLLRQFAFYLQRNGHEAYVYPTELFPKEEHLYTPYIFTRDEITALLEVAEKISPNRNFPTRHIVLPMLFRTLYCCGLRISEALDLTIDDIDFENGILALKNTKDYRDRLVPLSSDLQQRYRVYSQQLHTGNTGDSYFFQSDYGKQYSRAAVATNFRNLLWKCGISYGGRKKGPHLHDLRHTFSIHCLQRAMARGRDLKEFLPILSAYLGHKTLQGTQTYLHLTAELYPDILSRLEGHCSDIIPKAGDTNE